MFISLGLNFFIYNKIDSGIDEFLVFILLFVFWGFIKMIRGEDMVLR